MTEHISLNYEKIVWTYEKLNRAGEDSFDFTAGDDGETQIALLLPAVQKVETHSKPADVFTGAGQDDAMQGHTLVELLEIRGPIRVDDGGAAEMISDFIF